MGHGLTLRPCAGRRRTCLAAAVGRRRSRGRRAARILQSRRHTWRAPRRHTRGAGARCLCIKKPRRITVWAARQSISANRPRLAEAGRGWPGLEGTPSLVWRWRGVSKLESEWAEASGRLLSTQRGARAEHLHQVLAQRHARRQRRVRVITSGLASGTVGVDSVDLGVNHFGEDVGFDLGCEVNVRLTNALLSVAGMVSRASAVSVTSPR